MAVAWIKIFPERLVLFLLFALFVFSSTTHAQFGLNQKRITESQWSRGFHGFNLIAEGNELQRITVDEFQSTNSEEVLLVVFGRLNGLPVHVTNHVDNGGAALVASDSSLPNEKQIADFRFLKINKFPTKEADAFGGMKECPRVRDFGSHPIVSNVDEIVTNCPGSIWADRDSTLAWLPDPYRAGINGSFVAAKKAGNGGRAVAVGDQSVFTNQMILYGNNARFTNQAIKWLKDDKRKKLLVLVNGIEYTDLDPAEVVVNVPAPTQAEVFDALENLPASAMMEFANSVATVVEDENMVNDVIHESVENIPESMLRRFYVFLMFGVACLAFVAAFLCQGKLQSQTASEVALKRSRDEMGDVKVIQFRERQQAAHFLLDKFCVDLAGTRFGNWPSFPTGLDVGEDRQSKNIFESMTKMSILYKSKPTGYWTRKRLAWLEQEVSRWRLYFKSRPLQ